MRPGNKTGRNPGSLKTVTFDGVLADPGVGRVSHLQNTDVVIMEIILIGVIGFGIDLLMRWAERILVPWKGKA